MFKQLMALMIMGGCVSSRIELNSVSNSTELKAYLKQEFPNSSEAQINKEADKILAAIHHPAELQAVVPVAIKFEDYCQNKKQIKEFTVTKTFSLEGEGGEKLNALQLMLEQKKHLKNLDEDVQKNNYGKEMLSGYYFFPRQSEIDEYLKHGQNFVKTYSDGKCHGYKMRYEGQTLRYCMIPTNNDPLSNAIRRGVDGYLSANKDIKKSMIKDSVTYLITYNLSGFCEKAMRIE